MTYKERLKIKYDELTKYHHVYYLPEEHYIGMTNNIKRRMRMHTVKGKFTEGFEIIASFERSVDAHYLETMFQMRGYNGYIY